ncbi:DNA gyrase subunit A [Candidatus Woesearchaeota archaeon]|nr:DNA gyrase subunit A [Candidatus Woesearchaeota archaeon]
MTEKLIPTLIEKEMKDSYLDYSMSVIVGRALPDVRDGLKPVHRRILFIMDEMGLQFSKSFKKCARVVGDTMGKVHPHGDSAIYDALVRMAQDFNLRYPLIKGQGNFGATDFPAAASRYTECKLNKIAEQVLVDIEKDTVDFIPNFDGSLKEPVVLPSKIPNLLINGSSGIAVGMATNIPPHNIKEVCNAIISLIDNKDISDIELFSLVKGPDFPTGAQILGTNGIRQAYKTGKGKITIRSKCDIEDNNIIVREIPYQVSKSLLIEQIADLVKDKLIEGISDIRDESDKEGLRIVIENKKNSNNELILNQLYKNSQLQITFSIINLALVNGEPRVLSLRDMCLEFIIHRKKVITRRTKFDLRKAEERDHILQGLLIALKSIDEVIKLIKESENVESARNKLILNYTLTEIQSSAILDMKLSRLAALEQQKILDEHNELLNFIQEMKDILSSEERIKSIIKDELIGIKNEFGDDRRTEVIENNEEIENEDLIEKEQVVVTATHSGYIKRQPLDVYKSQNRGGKGIIGTETKDDTDFVEHLFIASSHSYILLFTDKGMVHWLKAYQVPESGRYAKGTAIVNLVKLDKDEKIAAMVSVDNFDNGFLLMATKKGIIKKTKLSEYSNPRQGGIIAINLRDDDKLIGVDITDGNKQIVLATKDGRAVRFKESDVRDVGRNSIGVRGINVKVSDVIGMQIVNAPYLLTITENGFGKRTPVEDYRLISRGGSGVTNIKITEKNGKVVTINVVNDNDELMLISKNGVIIRTPVNGISVIGRNTQGVRIMKLETEDKLATVARIINEEIDLEKKEDYKPSDANGNNIDNPSFDENEGEDEDKITNENPDSVDENEINEFLEKNNLEEKPIKKDFTIEGYEDKI